MFIIFGSRAFGKVDQVPGVCHVATKFAHVQYIPLIPTGTYAIFDDEHAVKIQFSIKSAATAWFRAIAVFITATAGCFAGVAFADHSMQEGTLAAMIAVAAVGGVFASYSLPKVSKASYERAMEIASQISDAPELHTRFAAPYGQEDSLNKWNELFQMSVLESPSCTST